LHHVLSAAGLLLGADHGSRRTAGEAEDNNRKKVSQHEPEDTMTEEEIIQLRNDLKLHKSNELRLRRERNEARELVAKLQKAAEEFTPFSDEEVRKQVEELEDELTRREEVGEFVKEFRKVIGRARRSLNEIEQDLWEARNAH
jgi:chromosome condensin MukBEF ATPase and DNA-binding subunit MukB